MRNVKKYAVLAVMSGIFSGAVAFASTPLKVGQVLSEVDVQALGSLKALTVNGRSLKVVSVGTGGSTSMPMTTVIDDRGAVGTTFHEVSVVEQPTGKLRGLSSVVGGAAAVKYYDAMGITLLRYASLEDAIEAVKRIQAEIPGANASVVVTFSLPKPN